MDELILKAKLDILELYKDENDDRPWAVAWSGGKDSTCVSGLVVSVLMGIPKEERKRHIYFVMSDTLMENPNLEEYMEQERLKLQKFANKNDLPITVKMVKRDLSNSYFYLVLGKGYPLPKSNGMNRWCTDKLKIIPQKEYLNEIAPSLVLSGSRSSESAQRSKSIEKFRLSEKIARYEGFKEEERQLFMPIVNFTVEDVWRYLTVEGIPWGSTIAVRKLYKEATGECGFSNPKGTEGVDVCGARFGCWTCPVIQNDRSTEKMAETHEWMTPLTEWRELQLKMYGDFKPPKKEKGQLKGEARKKRTLELAKWREYNEKIKMITKSGHMRNGRRLKDGQGSLTVESRKYLFDKLIETQTLVNRLRAYENLPPLQLIDDVEVKAIKNQWEKDEKECSYLVSNPLDKDLNEIKSYLG